uniref:Uncharacterized protein n=1 Tax=Vespula pensylvanica TaxID=30213 RepID=A0A834NXJ0_VESPE|nr:hypothetical protein H0235_010688 [Vespula pensylvanica]
MVKLSAGDIPWEDIREAGSDGSEKRREEKRKEEKRREEEAGETKREEKPKEEEEKKKKKKKEEEEEEEKALFAALARSGEPSRCASYLPRSSFMIFTLICNDRAHRIAAATADAVATAGVRFDGDASRRCTLCRLALCSVEHRFVLNIWINVSLSKRPKGSHEENKKKKRENRQAFRSSHAGYRTISRGHPLAMNRGEDRMRMRMRTRTRMRMWMWTRMWMWMRIEDEDSERE